MRFIGFAVFAFSLLACSAGAGGGSAPSGTTSGSAPSGRPLASGGTESAGGTCDTKGLLFQNRTHACQACMQRSCCDQITACLNDAHCLQFLNCWNDELCTSDEDSHACLQCSNQAMDRPDYVRG